MALKNSYMFSSQNELLCFRSFSSLGRLWCCLPVLFELAQVPWKNSHIILDETLRFHKFLCFDTFSFMCFINSIFHLKAHRITYIFIICTIGLSWPYYTLYVDWMKLICEYLLIYFWFLLHSLSSDYGM